MNSQDLDLSHFSIGGQDLAADPAAAPDLKKQQMLAKMLMGAQSRDQDTKTVNGWAVPNSGMSGVSDAIGNLMSQYVSGKGFGNGF